MTSEQQSVDFDTRPPMPVDEYAQTVRRVNVGYDLLFTLTHCFLRTLEQPALNLLVVGVGGGAEIERFLPDNPGWRLSGVDPSREMLTLAPTRRADDTTAAEGRSGRRPGRRPGALRVSCRARRAPRCSFRRSRSAPRRRAPAPA